MIRPTAIVLTAALALGLAACGSGGDDEQDVRSALSGYITATRAKDYQRLCDDLYSKRLSDSVRSAGLPCEVALRTGLDQVSKPTLVVKDVEVNEDQALAEVDTDAANQPPAAVTIRLVQESGDWRIASLATSQPQPQPEPKP